jgi:hypothetical protein
MSKNMKAVVGMKVDVALLFKRTYFQKTLIRAEIELSQIRY